jgi:hypothetical protein
VALAWRLAPDPTITTRSRRACVMILKAGGRISKVPERLARITAAKVWGRSLYDGAFQVRTSKALACRACD